MTVSITEDADIVGTKGFLRCRKNNCKLHMVYTLQKRFGLSVLFFRKERNRKEGSTSRIN